MRFNGGGNFHVAESQLKNLGQHRLNDERQIFTIIGRNTGSACIVNAVHIKENTNSRFFGEGVADTLEMYVNNLPVYLPNSKLCFIVAYGPRVFPDRDEQILPDVEILMSSEDYLLGQDVVLEYILDN